MVAAEAWHQSKRIELCFKHSFFVKENRSGDANMQQKPDPNNVTFVSDASQSMIKSNIENMKAGPEIHLHCFISNKIF